MSTTIMNLCKNGNLKEINKMYETYNIDIHANNDVAFRVSCYCGQLDVAKWLYSLGGVNVCAINDAFEMCCYSGNLDIIQWLYSLGGLNIHTDNDCAFKNSCLKNQKKIIEWLLLIDKFDNELVDRCLPMQYYEYAFSLGYLPVNKMKCDYAEYKNKIKDKIKKKYESGNISIFELSYLVDIIMIYV